VIHLPDPTGIGIYHNDNSPFSGRMFIADRVGYVLKLNSNLIGTVERWFTPGHGKGEYYRPSGIAIDSQNGNIFVSNSGNHRIEKLRSNGTHIVTAGKSGSSGSGPGEFNLPTAIALDPVKGDVFVCDTGNNRIQKLTNDCEFILELNGLQSMGIAVDANSNVYISDTNNHKIQKRTSDLQHLIAEWGQYGSGDYEFNLPYGIAADSNNNVFVADRLNHRVQIFNVNGSNINHTNSIITGGSAQFRTPFDVTIDYITESVYVSDDGYNSIQEFTKSGMFLKKKLL
jgi:DNA-binding beta-propeller fold protein YncE